VSCAIAALTLASVPRPAHAFKLGGGLIGIAGGNFQDKPDRNAGQVLDNNPGFGGPTIGGGLMFDARFLDKELLGLELDVIRSGDHGTGTYTINGISNKITIGQGAWHLPILAKLTFDVPVVSPAIFVGPEIVLPSQGSASVESPVFVPPGTIAQTADTYVMVTFGVGVEIKLPLPVIDLRLPIGIRGSFSPGVSSAYGDRTTNSLTPPLVTYRSEWKYAAAATLGAALYFF
jgi:hypothetical protein